MEIGGATWESVALSGNRWEAGKWREHKYESARNGGEQQLCAALGGNIHGNGSMGKTWQAITFGHVLTSGISRASVQYFISSELFELPLPEAQVGLPLRPSPLRPFPLRPFPLRPFPLRPFPLRLFPLRPFPLRPFPLRLFPLRQCPVGPLPVVPIPILAFLERPAFASMVPS